MFINQRIPMEISPTNLPNQAEPTADPVAEQMDAATKELSSFIGYLCDKYGAEFIVQRVIFSFVPRPQQEQESEDA